MVEAGTQSFRSAVVNVEPQLWMTTLRARLEWNVLCIRHLAHLGLRVLMEHFLITMAHVILWSPVIYVFAAICEHSAQDEHKRF